MDRLENKLHIVLITFIYITMFIPLTCLKTDSMLCDYTIRNFYLTIEHLMIVCVFIFLRRFINSFRN